MCVFAHKEKIRSCWQTQKQPCWTDGFKQTTCTVSLWPSLSLLFLIDLPFPILSLSVYFTFLTVISILVTVVYLAVCFVVNLSGVHRDREKSSLLCWIFFPSGWDSRTVVSDGWTDRWTNVWRLLSPCDMTVGLYRGDCCVMITGQEWLPQQHILGQEAT